MADTSALEAVAAILPPERRERFLTIAAKFEHLPEEDDHLQMLEATGFLPMAGKEVPERMVHLIAQMKTGISDEGLADLRDGIASDITRAIELPSLQELRAIAGKLHAGEDTLNRRAAAVVKRLDCLARGTTRTMTIGSCVAAAVLAGILGGAISIFAPNLWGALADGRMRQEPGGTQSAFQSGALEFEVATISGYGEVGILTIGGELLYSGSDAGMTTVVLRSGASVE